jgi:hypothetical protein
MSAPVDVVPP